MKKIYNLVSFKDIKNSIKVNTNINYFDYFLLTIVIFALLGDFIYLVSSTIIHLIDNKLVNATTNKFISGIDNLGDYTQLLLIGIFDKLRFILEPVQVNYSNEVLANQINDLSILLFVLCIIIFGLIVVLLLNIILYINMDRIIKFFNNKYIKWYLVINKKCLGIEIILLGGTILCFMYTLITGIRFIATHPIIIG